MSGWQALGEMITGQVGDPGAYQSGLKEGYTTQKAMQDARRAQSLAIIDEMRARSRGQVTGEALKELGFTQGADVLANILGSNSTMNMNQLGDFQRPGQVEAGAQARTLLGDTPDIEAGNRALAFMEGDQYEPYSLGAGGKAVFRGDTGEVGMTELGEVAVDAQGALADRRRRPPAAGGGRAPSAAASEAEVLAQARERIAAGADPRQVAEFLQAKGYPSVAVRIYKGE